MECPKCKAVLDNDARFCTYCGEKFVVDEKESAAVTPAASIDFPTLQSATENTVQKERRNIGIIDIIVGIAIIAIGISRIAGAGTSISSTSFGGDFYTYTYQGIVAISEILVSIEVSLGWVIVAIGSGIAIRGLHKQ